MTPISIYPSRWKNAILLIASIAVVLLFTVLFIHQKSHTQKDWIICMTCIICCGCLAAYTFGLIVRRRLLYIIDDTGVHNIKYDVVTPWSEISSLYVRKINSSEYIYLELNNPDKWWSKSKFTSTRPWVKTTRQFLGVTERTGAMLDLSYASVDTTLVVKVIQEMIELQSGISVSNRMQLQGSDSFNKSIA